MVEKKALFAYPAGTPVASLPKQGDTVVKHRGIDYLASQQTKFNAAFETALQDALACTAIRDGELVLSFEVEAGIFAGDPLGQSIPSIYWYYLVDRLKGEIALLRYRNGDPSDKLYGCIDEEGTE
ncbi:MULTISPECIES: hypothetical protein [unclassified Providencia]|uniref:hypothetical protein n=1 Tax=unclassified Providencia TaxID=2633465 RepID=UPI00234B673D|nr:MULTISPECIES: hypothetical protein [unclassified Providencia]